MGHSAGVIRSGPHLLEVLLFGGLRGKRITETSVLKIGKYKENCDIMYPIEI